MTLGIVTLLTSGLPPLISPTRVVERLANPAGRTAFRDVVYNVEKITNPSSDELWNQNYVQVASNAAARYNARFANAFDAIHTTDQICQITFLGTSGDAHSTDAGYRTIANLIWSVSGYDRLTGH